MTFKEAKEHLEEIEVEDKFLEENEPVPCLGDYYAETFKMAKIALDEMIKEEEKLMLKIDTINQLKENIDNFIDKVFCEQISGNRSITENEQDSLFHLTKSCEALEKLMVEYGNKLSK